MAVLPTVADLSALLGRSVPTPQGEQALKVTTQAAKAFVRGGATWAPNDEVASVILTAAARLVSNPSQLAYDTTYGPQSIGYRTGFNGFTVGEQQTLRRYRVTAR